MNPMGMGKRRRRRRCTGLDWIFNPMGMGKKRCALFNPMGMGIGKKKRRRCDGIFNPIGIGIGMGRRKKRCGDGDGDLLPLLPDDVLIQEILLCLPVKSLLRFKSVCKSWRQLIQSSFFIDLHTTSSKFGYSFIIQTTEASDKYEDDIRLIKLSSVDGDGPDGEYDEEEDDDNDHQKKKKKKKKKNMVFKADDLAFLPFYKDTQLSDTLRMVGSCNGIICLHDPELMNIRKGGSHRQHYSNLRDVCLWNPATRQFRILPKSIPIEEKPRYIDELHEDLVSFCFDVKTKDYKVLRITPIRNGWNGGGCMCRVQVYSLSTDSWRLLEGIHSLPVLLRPEQDQFLNGGIYLNGSYYFFVGRKPDSDGMMLLSFDFTKEIFTTMQPPPEYYSRYNCHMGLSSLGGKMALFDGCYKYSDIWVLTEQHSSGQGVVNNEEETSWTKLHSSKFLFQMKSSSSRTELGNPTCSISNNNGGEFALISTTWENNKLQLFNLVTKKAIQNFLIEYTQMILSKKRERIDTQLIMRRADVYKESLVSIMGGGYVLLRWQLPTHGTTYKLNWDAPFIGSCYSFGIGLCLISDTGGCIGVRSLKRRYMRDAEEGEAMAILEAIKWAKELKLSPIIIESDSKNIVSFFMDDDDDDDNDDDDDDDDDDDLTYWSSEALSLLEEAKLLLNSSEIGISFQYCYRSCNYVADIAAKLGRETLTWTGMDWTAKFPGEMVRSLSKDFASKTW